MGHNAGGYFVRENDEGDERDVGEHAAAAADSSSSYSVQRHHQGQGQEIHLQEQYHHHRQIQLPPFSSLPWIDRQLVREWRTYLPLDVVNNTNSSSSSGGGGDNMIHTNSGNTNSGNTNSTSNNNNNNATSTSDSTDRNGSSPTERHADGRVGGFNDNNNNNDGAAGEEQEEEGDDDFDRARTLVPSPVPRPRWQNADVCFDCHKPFGPVRLRHHCRFCGMSFCHAHSASTQRLPHMGYDPDVPERVCDLCERLLSEQNLAERVAWRLARCRDHGDGALTPYFETGLDTVEELALRVTRAALALARAVPLGAQATVAVETVDVLRKYGLHGIYGIVLRQEFLAAADLLRRALGINKTSWPLSVHELSAAIFYALAQHRAVRGLHPEREHRIHQCRRPSDSLPSPPPSLDRRRDGGTDEDELRRMAIPSATNKPSSSSGSNSNSNSSSRFDIPLMVDTYESSALEFHDNPVIDQTDSYHYPDPAITGAACANRSKTTPTDPRRPLPGTEWLSDRNVADGLPPTPTAPSFAPVCDPVPDTAMASLVFYAPIALNFIYSEKEVEMQLLAAQQGWRLLYAYLNQEMDTLKVKPADRPASALFVHEEYKIACLSIRGTATINDVITDIRQIPVPFPDVDPDQGTEENGGFNDDDWTNVFHGQGLALCGMASAAINLFREHIDSLLYFAKKGYRVRLVGHSLGGGVATLMGILVLRHIERFTGSDQNCDSMTSEETAPLKVYSYGTPSCLDAKLAESVDSFVTTVVLHDDVFPRLTPTSCRGLLKHLLHIRETWVNAHIEEDLRAVGERAKAAWAPRFRQNFALRSSPSSLKKYCKSHLQRGRKKSSPLNDKASGGPSIRSEGKSTNTSNEPTLEYGVGVTSGANEVESIASDASEWGEKFFVPDKGVSISPSVDKTSNEENETDARAGSEPQLLLEFLGGVDDQTEGLLVDGDEFFETEGNLLEDSDDGSEFASNTEIFSDPIAAPSEDSVHTSDSWSLDMHGGEGSPDVKRDSSVDASEDNGPVVLEESPLPRMYIPGKIIHIYSHRGVYKAAYVPRTFRELRRISLAGNMLSNHTAKSYFEGLLEVQTARVAPESPPNWTAFDEDDTCCCCANRFTWASTSNSEAQEARDKHNCRSCGGLVCDPCAKNRVPIPSIGVTVPVRVCDRCYNNIRGGVSAASSSMTSSFMAVDEDERTLSDSSPGRAGSESTDEIKERPERRRTKRSLVLDDLVCQMRSSALTHS